MSGLPDPAIPPELTTLEGALRDLLPRTASVNRDGLLFRAGQAAAPWRWVWPCATAAASAAAVVLGVLLVLRTAPVERIVYVRVQGPSAQQGPRGVDPPRSPNQGVDMPRSPNEEVDSPRSPNRGVDGPLSPYSPQRRLEEHLLRWGFDGLGVPVPDANPAERRFEFLSHSFSSMGE
jgi:hypothetical protein